MTNAGRHGRGKAPARPRPRRSARPTPPTHSPQATSSPQARAAAGVCAAARLPSDDDSHLPPRDRGAVRAYARDAVDARRPRPILLFMPAFAVMLITTFGPASQLGRNLLVGSLVVLAVVVVDAVILGTSIIRMARSEFPDAQVSGPATGWYVFMRAHRPRGMRTPAPRVRPAG